MIKSSGVFARSAGEKSHGDGEFLCFWGQTQCAASERGAVISALIPRSSSHTKHVILSPWPENIIPLHYMTLTRFRNHLLRALI